MMFALIAAGVLAAIVVAVLALRSSDKAAAPAATAATETKPAAVAPAAVVPPPAPVEAAKPAAETPPVEAAKPAAEQPAAKPSKHKHRPSDGEGEEVRADPLHRAIPVPVETPPDIKPFPTN